MAELVLGKAGAGVGSALLSKGMAFLGSATGGIAGAAVDGLLSPPVEGPRVREFHLTEGREGAGIPVVYGRCRVGGQLIWAAQFRERREVEGGKGGPRVADYSYSLSFAMALCEGEVSRVSRCWANGEPFDLSKVTWRLYRGTEDQEADPLIEAVEGDAPAYRGTAYVVFEDMPVDEFGARMPQMSFEVVRPAGGGAGRLEEVARAVNMIPGSGEFALSTEIVRRRNGPGREAAENLHGPELKSDFEASLDQLEAELPNVSRANLVVAWFGSDLRCGECLIRPGVEIAEKTTVPHAWSVAGVGRGDAYVVSSSEGRPNYGGTPSDESVREAVAMLKARGYHVTLYPFLLMDIPAGNGLPDPYGGEEQAAFPWRGRVTAVAGDVDAQVAAFFERYRSFVLHYAELADEAGADGVLIGSEMIGLMRAESGGTYPAVDALRELAGDVRAIVGPGVEISYAADWTEYGAAVVGDDVSFPLDALWADDAIDYVGIDWYPPMADWRDGEHLDAAFGDGHTHDYLAANVAGGEAFDWYYADGDARVAQARAAISDGAYGEPWVFRQKDVRGWWGAAHHPRVAGVRSVEATAWAPGMKPVRFVEMGAPAVNKGANQPNVFYDPKSSESALPHFSDVSRDDLIQRNAIEAFHAHWTDEANNPASEVYDGRMIPEDGIALWAWDARPYPAFPALDGVWGDAGNWRLGHWLNGRVGLAVLGDVVADICAKAGVAADVSAVTGVVTGYRFDGPVSARAALEPLLRVYGVEAIERAGQLVFRPRGAVGFQVDAGRLVETDGRALAVTHAGMENAETRVRLRFVDAEADQAPGLVVSRGGQAAAIADVEAAVVMDREQAQRVADALAEEMAEPRGVRFALAADGSVVEPGDVARIGDARWRIVDVSDGDVVAFEGVRAGLGRASVLAGAVPSAPKPPVGPVEPDVVIVDGPPLPGQEDDLRPIGFAFAEPWTGPIVFSAGADPTLMTKRGRIERPCTVGRLVSELYPHVSGRWQEASVWVAVVGGGLSSRTEVAVLNGANAALVETDDGWELVQFREAELVDVETYKLTGLLRGQQGSEEAMAAGAPAGSRVVVMTGAEQRLDVKAWEVGLELAWRAGRESAGGVAWVSNLSHDAIAKRMWSPAHLRFGWDGGDLLISWARRARTGGDSWMAGEPPHETPERYRVRVSGGISVREWEAGGPSALYAAGDQATDFPAGGTALIQVAQLGVDGQPGGWTGLELTIPAS